MPRSDRRVSRVPDGEQIWPRARPGVPKEARPSAAPGVHWRDPEPQAGGHEALARSGIAPAAVFGTGEPPRLLSGAVRRLAYRIPEYRTSHWLLLMGADRIDVWEHRIERNWYLFPALGLAAASYLITTRALRRRLG